MANGRKKIVMLVFNYFENDSRVLKEAFTLAENGYDIHIFSLWREGIPKTETLKENVYLTRLDFTPFHRRVMGTKNFQKLKNLVYKKKVAKPSSGNGNNKIANPYKNHKKSLSTLRFTLNVINKFFNYKGYYYRTKQNLKQTGLVPNFVHAHDLNTLPLGSKISRKYKAKLIYDSHELYTHKNRPFTTPKWFDKVETRIEQKHIRKCDKVITVSQSIVDYLAETYSIAKPTLIMNAPFMKKKMPLSDENNLRVKLNIADDKKVVIYSGGIAFNRGLDKVIESIKYVPNVHLVFLGGGDKGFKNYLQSVANYNEVADRFDFFGPVQSFEVTSFVQSADLGVAPIENVCLSYYFCAPNKVFEYIQGGIPVIASAFPDMELVIKSNDIGLTFDPESPEDIAEKINFMFNNPSEFEKYKENVSKISDKYKWENEAKTLISLYQDLS